MVDMLGLKKDAVALHYYGWNYLGWDITDSNKAPENCDN
jgi:hypothetical protein